MFGQGRKGVRGKKLWIKLTLAGGGGGGMGVAQINPRKSKKQNI